MTKPISSRKPCHLFLDIDGVLNWRDFLRSVPARELAARSRGEILDSDLAQIDPTRVALLNGIIQKTGCTVVVSSTWRLFHSLSRLELLLQQSGFVGQLIGKTPDMGTERGDEISAWLSSHAFPDTRFCILDDNADMGKLLPMLVQTSFITGLVESDCEKACSLLNNGLPVQPAPETW